MGKDLTGYLEHFNTQNFQWEPLQIYARNPYNSTNSLEEIPFIDGGWGPCAEILTGSSLYPKLDGVIKNIPNDISPVTQIKINKLYDPQTHELSLGYFNLAYINIAEIKIYTLQYPQVRDYDIEWEEGTVAPTAANPFIWLLDKVSFFLSVTNTWETSLSNLRLIFWGDC